ncbi:MAG: SDR family NAD(P)-dependent oxidoreductase [Spongiibacteraceae bacterium]|nr:SDR family NAD(P)-dependent oxidoreductase [Spongiibacteraceae bacterium]
MLTQILNLINFYIRFLISFSNIGYRCRRFFWSNQHFDFSAQTWLVTGASGGIGKATVVGALRSGAKVIVVARSDQKLRALKRGLPKRWADNIELRVADLSLQTQVHLLIEQLAEQSVKINVLVNNVGVLLDELTITTEGVETAFATNVLNHFQLTQALLEKQMLAEDASVVNVTSGGMYHVPLAIESLDIQSDAYNGVSAYAFHKRAQVVLTQYWRKHSAGANRQFYVMHPGWVDTQGVKTSLPRFRKLLKSILRNSEGGADTILWLAGARPGQDQSDAVWFDRKPRKAHYFRSSMQGSSGAEQLVDYLRSRLI